MALDSMDRMFLLNEIQVLKAKLNLASDLAREVRHFLNKQELSNERIKELRDYASDLSDFLKTK